MSIVALPVFKDNYIWLIVHESRRELTCIDPGEAKSLLKYAKQNHLTIRHVLLTHHHDDHCAGVDELKQSFPQLIVYGPADERIASLVTHPVYDENMIHLDTLAFRILHTPGHTCSHVCYQEPTQGWLFSGDTLFSGGCGRVFDGTIEQLYQSIIMLKKLPSDTQVFCGHEYTRKNLEFASFIEPHDAMIRSYLTQLEKSPNQCSLPSTIGLEKQINLFMRTDELSIKEFMNSQGTPSDDPFIIFKALRALKDSF